jgi:hypothetical protein
MPRERLILLRWRDIFKRVIGTQRLSIFVRAGLITYPAGAVIFLRWRCAGVWALRYPTAVIQDL